MVKLSHLLAHLGGIIVRNAIMLLALWGCEPGKIGLNDTGEDAEGDTSAPDTDDTDTGDTDVVDTSVDTALAEERAPVAQINGVPFGMAGMALDEDDFDGDVRDDLLVGAPGFDPSAPSAVAPNPGPGTVYLLPGPIRGDTPLAQATVRFAGMEDWDGFGASLTHGDFNHDGVKDVAIGGGVVTDAVPDASGFVSVSYGPFASVVPVSDSTLLTRGLGGDAFGAATVVGDLDGDGIDDLAVGSPLGGDGGSGEVGLYRGSATGMRNSPYARVFSGVTYDVKLGTALVMGDVDGDGASDLLVGAEGTTYLFLGPINNDHSTDAADARFAGVAEGDLAGASLGLADMNGDGHRDALIGAPHSDQAGVPGTGAVYLVHGPLQGAMPLSEANAVLAGAQEGGAAGTGVAYANDMNNDGQADLIVGAPYYDDGDMIDAGRGYLVLGPVEGWMPLAEAVYVRGTMSGGQTGRAVRGDTELTGGDRPDVLFAAPWVDATGSRSGDVLLLAGE